MTPTALWDITLAGDDEPVPMADRPQLREIMPMQEPGAKLRRYAAFVRGRYEAAHRQAFAAFAEPRLRLDPAPTQVER
jgi:hypothetical protein